MNLNSNLYERFGIKLKLKKVQDGFSVHLKNLLIEYLDPLVNPEGYKEPQELWTIRDNILREACRQMFIDHNRYTRYTNGFKDFVEHSMSIHGNSFEERLINLQILLNVLSDSGELGAHLKNLTKNTSAYLKDFPILGLKLKEYKTKPPQLIPSVSKYFDKQIDNVLGLLEQERYKSVLDSFEEGLKEFLLAKNKSNLKDSVEDMYTACDEMAKEVLGNKNKGFKHIFDKDEYKKFGFSNKNSKEAYRNLKDWMDGIKHGSLKQYDREDVEMIISLVAELIRFTINKTS